MQGISQHSHTVSKHVLLMNVRVHYEHEPGPSKILNIMTCASAPSEPTSKNACPQKLKRFLELWPPVEKQDPPAYWIKTDLTSRW